MTKNQIETIEKEIILLTINDVIKVTGWCEQTVRSIFAHDKDFPAIKKGKNYQVELNALKEYLSKRRSDYG